MKTEIERVAAERAPLEHRRARLLRELDNVNEQLARIGLPSGTNAALRFIASHPGASTTEIRAATGVCVEILSRLVQRGVLRNSGRRGRGVISHWWMASAKGSKDT